MKARRIGIVAAAFVCAVAVLSVLALMRHPKLSPSNRLRVTATFYPMAEFSRQVGGNKIIVTTLVKPGTEPHDYDPTPQDAAGMYASNVFVYNGAGLERWAAKLQTDLQKQHVTVVQASAGIALEAPDASEADAQSVADPHVWMDPALAVVEVRNIQQGFTKADPANKAVYSANASAYIKQLQALDAAFATGLATCRLHTIITSHQAFSYLGAHYGLRAVGIAGLSPDNEPSPQKLAEVAAIAKKDNVHSIFFENLVSPKLSQTLAKEIGAQATTFNPLEGLTTNELKKGKNYISIQKDNLQALRTALNCK